MLIVSSFLTGAYRRALHKISAYLYDIWFRLPSGPESIVFRCSVTHSTAVVLMWVQVWSLNTRLKCMHTYTI